MKTLLLFLGLSVVALHADGPDTNSLNGTWTCEFAMPDTSVVHPRVKLVHKDGQLSGVSIVRPGTETAITNATVQGHRVRFDVVRARNGVTVLTHYEGKWDGDSIKGTLDSDWTGALKSYPWEARRHSSLTGNWKWTSRTFGGRGETRAQLKLENGKLTGSIRGRDGRDTAITNATFENGEVTFEVERERDGAVSVQVYKGQFADGAITGTVEFFFDANADGRKSDWKAERVD